MCAIYEFDNSIAYKFHLKRELNNDYFVHFQIRKGVTADAEQVLP